MKRIYIVFGVIVVALLGWIGYVKWTGYQDAQGHKAYLCVDNLRRIDAAKMHYATVHGLKPGDNIPIDALTNELAWPRPLQCPSGGTYKINPVGIDPTCTIPGHQLQ
jgi:hypothetical protein